MGHKPIFSLTRNPKKYGHKPETRKKTDINPKINPRTPRTVPSLTKPEP